MADTIIDNINSIIRTKSELKSVLTENGQNPSDTFSEYPDMFRAAIEGAGADEETINSYISAYLSTYNFIDQTTLSANSYITLQDIPSVDLSSYVTYDFLNAQSYVTETYVGQMIENATTIEVNAGAGAAIVTDWKDVLEESGLITPAVGEDEIGYDIMDIHQHIDTTVETWLNLSSYVTQAQLNNAGYLTSIPNTYPTYTAIENMAYITMADVSACGYITANDIPSVVVPVIDENLIPKETNTYTLGDSSHLYSTTYTNNIFMDGHSITYRNSTSILFSIANRDNFIMLSSAFCPSRVGMNLGMDYVSNKWNSTYTANIYADNAYISNYNNFIWTGTSAQYAALDNYTTYQIYLIQEA